MKQNRSPVAWAGIAASSVALAGLIAIGPPGSARAASRPGYDQITGVGETASGITVPWTQGLLDLSNKPIASANADRNNPTPTSPLSFMYPDFKNLKVTVSQTTNIVHQGLTVSWTGALPTPTSGFGGDFMQIMQCYGDSPDGPSPKDCEYGTPGLLPAGLQSAMGGRSGQLCAPGAVPSTTTPPPTQAGAGAPAGCDTQEPGSSPEDIQPCPPNCSGGTYNVPFDPLNGALIYGSGDEGTGQYFNRFNTNEVQEAVTGPDGTGQQHFEVLTSTEAPALGCGDSDAGQPRGCWLVIVPRGQYEPNGYKQ